MLCQTCNKKSSCKELCAEAERYVNQDYTGRKESIVGQGDVMPAEWPKVGTTEAILKLFFLERKKPSEIASILDVSKRYVNKVIKNYKAKMAVLIKKTVPSRRR